MGFNYGSFQICNGHEERVKKCYSREEVRKESELILKKFEKDPFIRSVTTHMVEGQEKRKFFGKKNVYDLYITYFHEDNFFDCSNSAPKSFSLSRVDKITITPNNKILGTIFNYIFPPLFYAATIQNLK